MKNVEILIDEETIRNPRNPDFLSLMLLEVLRDNISKENLFALECIKLSYAKRGYVNPKFQRIIESYKECIERYDKSGGGAR